MLMIVILHVLKHGGVLDSTETFSVEYRTAWFIEICAYCAVNCYALISGYVGLYSRHKYSSLIVLWLRVVFYSAGITIIFRVLHLSNANIKGILLTFFPMLRMQYWYFTAYFLLFLFIPILNSAILNISKYQLRIAIMAILFFTSIIFPIANTFLIGDIWNLGGGYTPIWLMILYIIGGYIRKYGLFRNKKAICFLVSYFISVLFTWGFQWIMQIVTKRFLGEVRYDGMWISYISISVLISAVSLLLLFERIQFKALPIKIISIISPLTFSVYLIHDNTLIREHFIKDKFIWITNYSAPVQVVLILSVAVAIYIICIAIDYVRELLFKGLRVKNLVTRAENLIKNKLNHSS